MNGIGLSVTRERGIAHIELDRPEARNALGPQQFARLLELVRECDADPEMRAIWLSAKGKHFCTGADMAAKWPRSASEIVDEGHAERQVLMHCSKPVLVSAQGAIIGAGAELALSADIILLAEDALFSFPELSMNTLPLAGTIGRLTSLCGRLRAAEIVVSGRKIFAAEALRIGLASRVVGAADLQKSAGQLAEAIAKRPAELLVDLKKLLRDADPANSTDRLDAERQASAIAFEKAMEASS